MIGLLEYLQTQGLSGKAAREAMSSGKVWYRGAPVSHPTRYVEPDEVEINERAPRITVGRDFSILHKEEHFAVVWKPSGMLSMATAGRSGSLNLISEMAKQLGAVYPVHRLDEGTSGLMLVGLTPTGQVRLKDMIFHHKIERKYLCWASGAFPHKEISHRQAVYEESVEQEEEFDGSYEALPTTHFRRLFSLGEHASLLEATLESGKTHQIRIHLSQLEHPIFGDKRYSNRWIAAKSKRLALHSYSLRFDHPFENTEFYLTVPLPDDMLVFPRQSGFAEGTSAEILLPDSPWKNGDFRYDLRGAEAHQEVRKAKAEAEKARKIAAGILPAEDETDTSKFSKKTGGTVEAPVRAKKKTRSGKKRPPNHARRAAKKAERKAAASASHSPSNHSEE